MRAGRLARQAQLPRCCGFFFLFVCLLRCFWGFFFFFGKANFSIAAPKSLLAAAAPAGPPQSVIDCFDAAIKKATQHKAFRKLTKKAGLAVIYRNAADSKALLLKLRDAWKPTIDFVKKRMAKK